MQKKIILIGCGKMGMAMVGGWLQQDITKADIAIIDPLPLNDHLDGIDHYLKAQDIPHDLKAVVIIAAVKPQIMDEALKSAHDLIKRSGFLLSIAAGKSLGYFANILGKDTPIIRSMPNTPALIQQGVSVIIANAHIDEAQNQFAIKLLNAIGDVYVTDNEEDIDIVTGVSGSGPAYIFLMIEAMAAAGCRLGLTPELAQKLALKTCAGAANLALQSEQSPAQLRQNVTSPNGTTFEALKILHNDKHGLIPLMDKAIEAATRRSNELS